MFNIILMYFWFYKDFDLPDFKTQIHFIHPIGAFKRNLVDRKNLIVSQHLFAHSCLDAEHTSAMATLIFRGVEDITNL